MPPTGNGLAAALPRMSKLEHAPASGPPAAVPKSAPRLRTLALLVMGVLLVHGLALRTTPSRFGAELDPAARRAPTFVTRTIQPAPVPEVSAAPLAVPAPAPAPAPKPVVKAIKKPVIRTNRPSAQAIASSNATELIAPIESEQPAPEALASEASATSTEADSAPAISTETAAAAPAEVTSAAPEPAAAAVPVSPAAELPAGPRQTVVTDFKLPESARLSYKVIGGAKGLNYHARAELLWQNSVSQYAASLTVSALFIGSRSMASQGQIVSEGLAPGRFADKYKSEVAAHFEPAKGQVSFSANTPTVPWIKGMQDRVSVFFQLAGMLAAKPDDFPVGSTISMVTVGPRDADGWTFVVEAAETLVLPFGEMGTLKLSRQPRKEFDQKVEIWYAPSLGYLPVRSKITQSNGDFVDQQLTAVDKLSE